MHSVERELHTLLRDARLLSLAIAFSITITAGFKTYQINVASRCSTSLSLAATIVDHDAANKSSDLKPGGDLGRDVGKRSEKTREGKGRQETARKSCWRMETGKAISSPVPLHDNFWRAASCE